VRPDAGGALGQEVEVERVARRGVREIGARLARRRVDLDVGARAVLCVHIIRELVHQPQHLGALGVEELAVAALRREDLEAGLLHQPVDARADVRGLARPGSQGRRHDPGVLLELDEGHVGAGREPEAPREVRELAEPFGARGRRGKVRVVHGLVVEQHPLDAVLPIGHAPLEGAARLADHGRPGHLRAVGERRVHAVEELRGLERVLRVDVEHAALQEGRLAHMQVARERRERRGGLGPQRVEEREAEAL
jgi:hypothetical protein